MRADLPRRAREVVQFRTTTRTDGQTVNAPRCLVECKRDIRALTFTQRKSLRTVNEPQYLCRWTCKADAFRKF